MGVAPMMVVNAGLAAVVAGGLLLLLSALWWSWTGDGIEVPRERWPALVRGLVAAGWTLWGAGFLVQFLAYFTSVGVARWQW